MQRMGRSGDRRERRDANFINEEEVEDEKEILIDQYLQHQEDELRYPEHIIIDGAVLPSPWM